MKHNNRKSNNMLKILEKDGFTCEPLKKNRNKFFISKGNGERYLIHSGEKAFVPLKRWLKKIYNYEFVF
jgi:hypothetical protein